MQVKELRETKSKIEISLKKVQSEKKEAPDQSKALEAMRVELRDAVKQVRTRRSLQYMQITLPYILKIEQTEQRAHDNVLYSTLHVLSVKLVL